jgi:hypothetical protein
MAKARASLLDYVLERIELDDGCWPWTGVILDTGYGQANLEGGRRRAMAHRAVYELVRGEIPAGLVLDHECHNRDDSCRLNSACPHRRCVNPWHLAPKTAGDNCRAGHTVLAENLAKEACPAGHPYSHTDDRGWRKCATCISESVTARARQRGVRPTRAGSPECVRGHVYTPETTRLSPQGKRNCRLCDADNQKARRARLAPPCKRCGGPKEPGRGKQYCDGCATVEVLRAVR